MKNFSVGFTIRKGGVHYKCTWVNANAKGHLSVRRTFQKNGRDVDFVLGSVCLPELSCGELGCSLYLRGTNSSYDNIELQLEENKFVDFFGGILRMMTIADEIASNSFLEDKEKHEESFVDCYGDVIVLNEKTIPKLAKFFGGWK